LYIIFLVMPCMYVVFTKQKETLGKDSIFSQPKTIIMKFTSFSAATSALTTLFLVTPSRGNLISRFLSGIGDEEVTELDLMSCKESLAQFLDPPRPFVGDNICEGTDPAFVTINCTVDGVVTALEQAGANVTAGHVGGLDTAAEPITTTFFEAGLCPVNVHWHRGAEHYSAGEYDESGTGPVRELDEGGHGSYATAEPRLGFECLFYDEADPKFTTPYDWKFCEDMQVGETYEVHWPHSTAGACGTPHQYQTPFADGVFCKSNAIALDPLFLSVGVQAQVFVIVNDDSYYYPDLMRGMIVEGEMGAEVTKYTGSTTGSSVNNVTCSQYTPITWQVDRKCHMISASSFDKLCSDMLSQSDDMSGDVEPHGARELVPDELAANNHQNRAFRY
jgi:Delta carbonic anhydrase